MKHGETTDKKSSNDHRPRPPGPEAPRPTARKPQGNQRPPVLGWPWMLLLLIFLAANWVVVPLFFPEKSNRVTVPYTTFREQIEAGNVAEITSQGDAIQGAFREAVTYPPTGDNQKTATQFETR